MKHPWTLHWLTYTNAFNELSSTRYITSQSLHTSEHKAMHTGTRALRACNAGPLVYIQYILDTYNSNIYWRKDIRIWCGFLPPCDREKGWVVASSGHCRAMQLYNNERINERTGRSADPTNERTRQHDFWFEDRAVREWVFHAFKNEMITSRRDFNT